MKSKSQFTIFVYFFAAILLIAFSSRLFGEDPSEQVEVTLSSDVDFKRVPLNRSLVLTVRVS